MRHDVKCITCLFHLCTNIFIQNVLYITAGFTRHALEHPCRNVHEFIRAMHKHAVSIVFRGNVEQLISPFARSKIILVTRSLRPVELCDIALIDLSVQLHDKIPVIIEPCGNHVAVFYFSAVGRQRLDVDSALITILILKLDPACCGTTDLRPSEGHIPKRNLITFARRPLKRL